MAKTGQDDTDYDRQFQEDLEKAQALSLETLALEKFRMEKLRMELHRYQSQTEKDQKIRILKQDKSFSRESSVESTISTSIESRSRPRPGSFNTGGPCVYQIKPPPAGRRNSVATPATSDLISFTSPTNTHNSTAAANPPHQFHLSNNQKPTSSILAEHSIKNLSCLPSTSLRSGFRDIGFDLTNLGSELSGITPLSTTSTFPAAPPPGFFMSPHPSSGHHAVNSYMYSFDLSASTATPTATPVPTLSSGSTSTTTTLYNGCNNSVNVLKTVEKRDNSNLIDLTPFDSELPQRDRGVRVSLLEAFDPLLTSSQAYSQSTLAEDTDMREDDQSECSGSVYDPYDPFDYLYSPPSIAGSQASDPIYAAVVKASPISPPPLPPRNTAAKLSAERKSHRQSKLYDSVLVEKHKPVLTDPDLVAFHTMVKALRAEFVHSDPYTNVGLVISPLIESSYLQGTSVKLTIHCPDKEQPLTFTSDVSCSIDLVMEQIICGLLDAGSPTDYVLKVWGLAEYLTTHTQLADYEYVHQCIKLEQDIRLVLVHVDHLPRPLARTPQDDERDKDLTLEDLLPKEPVQPISRETLQILLETLEREMERVEAAGEGSVQPHKVTQAVKAVCALLGSVETLAITQALEAFNRACGQLSQTPQEESWRRPEIVDEDGDYSVVLFPGEIASETISGHCERIREAVQGLIQTYALAFRVDFQITDYLAPTNDTTKLSSEVLDTVLVHVECLHRLSASWTHDTYMVAGQLYHGTRPVGHPVLSKPTSPSTSLYNRIVFDSWLNFEGMSVCELPRECRLVLVVYGRSVTPAAEGENAAAAQEMTQVELGWSAVQFFNYNGVLVQGSLLLSVWPPGADKRLGPAPASGTQPHGDTHPVLGVELPDYGSRVEFPPLIKEVEQDSFSTSHDFESLDGNTQDLLKDIIAQDTFTRPLLEDREILWEKRHYLVSQPQALPKVLLAAHSWDYACLSDLHAMLHTWAPLEPVSALQLLLPCFPDREVRRVAVSWIQDLSSDELVDYLPQLVQALKHETYETSPLARLLLERALTSPRVAHHLYWLLTQALPGNSPQNSSEVGVEDQSVCEARYFRRLQLILRALLAISGEAPRQRFMSQQLLVKSLYEVAETVKTTKESHRMKALLASLEGVHASLEATSTCLPLGPSMEVAGVQVRSCSYFPSNTLPLKINFNCGDSCIIPAIFKVGDDLQQDMLTLQMIRIMDKLWLKEGLDLKMVTFACVPTGTKRGMIEMVTEAETLRKIQVVELGPAGSFKDRTIAEWLAKHNPSALEYERAVANFTASCAGYSVATYVLGICDRHNDNIMLKTSGHLFHIDFGKFLGDAQMFGNFKRDRTPFVLTSDMAYVINGGDKPSAKFHHFVDLCCQAFNIVRKHGNLILNLFGLMASSGISGVTMDAVRYIQRSLLLDLTNPEAAAMFARMIQSSLKSWFTQFNFFLHNLAQLRFTGDHNDGELLSFVPRTYSMAAEGRLQSVEVYGYQKRYDPDKYYTYILRVQRVSQRDPTYLFRSYKEFVEFQQKLCIHFPLAKCYSLQSTSLHMGRSNIKQVAEKRLVDIKRFLVSLFKMADEICHSDLVYTFFHPLLRDQQEASIHEQKLKERKKERIINSDSWRLRGQLKLSLHYQRGTLMVMVHHARELPTANGQEPSTYVKVYLLPDPHKQTKRKTKVIRRSCHPSFMEMLEYRMPLEIVQHRVLQATVWNHDPLQENEFLGGVSLPLESLDLGRETVQWYGLGNVHR
ncbi:phosphatidylinositol 4-phosphate 3-kinase C2 domain-containing subunit beta-like [Macrosteles quadrilineatus]|uniref:phosphatidylinositol 4-phosphate 3-kinase C2 domain-containing subunit beta-like n=1 Tax=Macrosteles quadrilineatus TaxID=74068 RepID=UPI0023E1439E|nr:phosphatidylinositol 4-phosphate 3-kinase C2 domain-containing subunit beta-like [Macrosteles quadrilineatus]